MTANIIFIAPVCSESECQDLLLVVTELVSHLPVDEASIAGALVHDSDAEHGQVAVMQMAALDHVDVLICFGDTDTTLNLNPPLRTADDIRPVYLPFHFRKTNVIRLPAPHVLPSWWDVNQERARASLNQALTATTENTPTVLWPSSRWN